MDKVQLNGFTLIELLVVVVIVAILAAIAIPSYQNQVIKSGRAEGKSALMSAAQFMERCTLRNDNNAGYAFDACTGVFPSNSTENLYTIALSTATQSTFTLSATPQGPQTRDADCTTLTIDQSGRRGATGADPSNCW
jgi:type IV pilus assembly protein PilE